VQNNFKELRDEQLEYKCKLKNFKSVLLEIENSQYSNIKERFVNSKLVEEVDGMIIKLNDSNLSISVIAEVSNGKSTFLNSLIFRENILDSGAGAVTARIFQIGYGDNYSIKTSNQEKNYTDIKELQSAVKQLNQDTREKVDSDNSSNNDLKEVEIKLPHESLKDGIIVYDTPGFGALDEEIVFPLIEKAINKSDAVIMLLDISQGLKKGEDTFIKTTLKSIDPKKRFIVFNKYDAVVNEDQKILMSENEINEQLQKVTNDTLNNLVEISDIQKDEIDYSLLSSQKALVGYIRKNDKALEESKFKEFEDKFWKKIIENKEEIFKDRIKNSITKINNSEDILKKLYKDTESQINQLDNLVSSMIEKNAEFSVFAKQSVNALNEEIIKFQNNKSNSINIDTLLDKIGEVVNKAIFDSLEEINWWDKTKVWNLKSVYLDKIENALEDSEDLITEVINDYINNIHKNLFSAQEDINIIISDINRKLENYYSDLNIEPLKEINILTKNASGVIDINLASDFSEHISIDKETFSIIGGIIAEIIATRFAMMIPGIGLIISGVVFAVMKFYKSKNNPNEELALKVTEEIKINLKKGLSDKLEPYKAQTNQIKNAMTSTIFDGKAKLDYIKNSLEDPLSKQKEIEELNNILKEIEIYDKKINKIKDDKCL